MNWKQRQEAVIRQVGPEVAAFVEESFTRLERENVFDAPGVISGIIRQMRLSDCDVVRGAADRTERLLKSVFARGSLHQLGA